MGSVPLINMACFCGFIAHLQCLASLPFMVEFSEFALRVANYVIEPETTHRCSTIVTALQLMLDPAVLTMNGAVTVAFDYNGDMHSIFVDNGVPSMNNTMRQGLTMDYDLIQATLFQVGRPFVIGEIAANTLYVADLSETSTLTQYTARVDAMSTHGLELKGIALHTGGYHFIALTESQNGIYEYNDSQLIRVYSSWEIAFSQAKFAGYKVTSAWYYRHAGRKNAEMLMTPVLMAQYLA